MLFKQNLTTVSRGKSPHDRQFTDKAYLSNIREFIRVLATRWRRKRASIGMERN